MWLVKFANNKIESTNFNGTHSKICKKEKKKKNILHVAHQEMKKNKKSPSSSSSSCGSFIQSSVDLGYMKIWLHVGIVTK
jgi:hypothetical protein